MPAPITRALADFIGGAAESHVPSGALEIIRTGFTDAIACLLAGRHEPVVTALRRFESSRGGRPEARLLLGNERIPAAEAALVNATAAHALDLDDYAYSNHPSAVMVPAILAAAEPRGANGMRMALAYAVGYEVWGELMLREPDHIYAKSWHPTGVLGPLGAAAAASVVLGLDSRQSLHALALAASFAGGVMENFGTMSKPIHAGRAAQSGVLAAQMAAAGLEASPTALEGARGLMWAISPNGKIDRESAPQLGRSWRLPALRLNIKKYATVGASQRSIDSILAFLKTTKIDSRRVVKIEPLVSEKHAAVMPFHDAQTALEAKFSLEFTSACAIAHGRVGLAELKDEVVQSPEIRRLMKCVSIRTTTEFDPGYTNAAPFDEVRITMDDGTVHVTPPIKRATGHADVPLTREELWAKFADCANAGGVAPALAQALFERMQAVDRMASVGDIPVLS
jgi:2-methylcitrate dehydratase PrpD